MRPLRVQDLPTPALVVDRARLEGNLRRMADKAARLGVTLRPHAKTHKCVEIAHRQRQLGARGLTVATLHEARVFADHGGHDLLWAFPIPLSRIRQARRLAERVTLRLVLDSVPAVEGLESFGFPFHVWLKVDGGYHRAGVDPGSADAMVLARRLARSSVLHFDGLLTHGGHAYRGRTRGEVRRAAEEARDLTVGLADRLRRQGIEVPAVSVGSTPGMVALEDLSGVDEARPGNYAFFDGMQVALGSCRPTEVAVSVLASVVSTQAEHSVVDAGALALSKDCDDAPEGSAYGRVFADYTRGALDPDLRVTGLSQEHGLLSRPLPVGTLVRILPWHSCLTVACFDELWVAEGDAVVDRWRVWRGRD